MVPYYERGGIQLFHASCLDVLPQLDSVDHVITDPPYEAEAHTKGRRVNRAGIGGEHPWIGAHGVARFESLPFDAITDELRNAVAAEIGRVTKRWALVFTQAEAAHKWEAALVENGLNRRRWCVWVKPGAQPQFSGDRPGVGYETIVTCHRPGRSAWNGGGRVGVFSHIAAREGNHSTEKPIALMRQLVSLFTDPGDTVLDPFMGSGTTLVAAKHLGRKAIGVEIFEEYCEITAKRLEQETLPFRFEQVQERQCSSQPSMFTSVALPTKRDEVGIEMSVLNTCEISDGE